MLKHRNRTLGWGLLIALLLVSTQAVFSQVVEQKVVDYLGEIKSKQQAFYPEETTYFAPILEEICNFPDFGKEIFNCNIEKAIKESQKMGFLTDEKDRITVVLITLEFAVNKNEFSKRVEFIDPEEMVDLRRFTAREAIKGIAKDVDYAEKAATQRAEAATQEAEVARREREAATQRAETATQEAEVARREREAVTQRAEAATRKLNKTLDETEQLLAQSKLEDVKNVPSLQNVIKGYIMGCKSNNRKPNAIGQKFIDEYNKIQKSNP